MHGAPLNARHTPSPHGRRTTESSPPFCEVGTNATEPPTSQMRPLRPREETLTPKAQAPTHAARACQAPCPTPDGPEKPTMTPLSHGESTGSSGGLVLNGLVATRGQLRLEHPLPHGPRSRHGGRWCHLPADTEASRRTVEKGPHACGWGAVGHGLRAPTPATSSATARVTNAAPGQDLRLPTPPTPLEVRCRPPPGSGAGPGPTAGASPPPRPGSWAGQDALSEHGF